MSHVPHRLVQARDKGVQRMQQGRRTDALGGVRCATQLARKLAAIACFHLSRRGDLGTARVQRLNRFPAAPSAHPPPHKPHRCQSADHQKCRQRMVLHHAHCARPQLENQQAQQHPPHHAAAEHGPHKRQDRHFNTPAANTNSFHGVGGGSMDGIAIARNSCFSNRMRNRS